MFHRAPTWDARTYVRRTPADSRNLPFRFKGTLELPPRMFNSAQPNRGNGSGMSTRLDVETHSSPDSITTLKNRLRLAEQSASDTAIWRMERGGKFPGRRRISANAVRWLAEDVEYWITTCTLGG